MTETPEFFERIQTVTEDALGVTGAQQHGKPNGLVPNESDNEPLLCEHLPAHSISSIPPRQWAYDKFLLFGSTAVIGAVDGGGKGAIAVVIALSMITGRALLGEHVWRTGSVAIITYEDDKIEWSRRIAAACLRYQIRYESAIEQFHFISRPGGHVRFAAPGERGMVFPDGDAIIAHLKAIDTVLLIIDPFNQAHTLDDGNNNVMIAKVARELNRIATAANVAALVLHHLRKGATGAPDDLMGALSLRATFRSCRILARMKEDQAKTLQVPERQAWRYSRIVGSKENYAPPPELTTWYKLESIDLNNPDALYTAGDNVQVAVSWTPPSAFAGISHTDLAAIFAKLRVPPRPGCRYSSARQAKDWVGDPIVDITGLDPEAAARCVSGWLDTGVLIKATYQKDGHKLNCVTLNEVKVAEILGPRFNSLENNEPESFGTDLADILGTKYDTATARVPFIITAAMKCDLAARGFSPEEIRYMTPQQAHDALSNAAAPEERPPGATPSPDLRQE